MQRTKPPFRADQVGSLLRSAPVKEARTKRAHRRDHAGRAEGGRGCRDQQARGQAGIDRPAGGDRRRVQALVVALRFPQPSRRRRTGERGAGPAVQGHANQGRGPACARQDRLLALASHDRPLQVPEVGGQGGAQDDHPVADGAALSRRPAGDREVGLSRDGAVLRRSGKGLRQGGARLRRGGLHLPAARRGLRGLSLRRGAARLPARPRRRSRTGCCTSMPTW